eukprot:TRINITY_DN1439_c0_g1_i1.p1 TRINITY_DN1439_c0_g1~~TRINITY_DN1439_c0_g1_i1.p1  ORF type:complete len:161 (+),score=14.08 TRINITY_DN1439_c0_g1_i1:36-518(+)
MLKRTFLLLLLSLLVFTVRCEEDDDEPSVADRTCSSNDDCVPLPSCHPRYCINKDNYEKFNVSFASDTVCTLEMRCNAAYTPKDCRCEKKKCINRNAKNNGACESDDDEDEDFGFAEVSLIGVGLFVVAVGGFAAVYYIRKRRQQRFAFQELELQPETSH